MAKKPLIKKSTPRPGNPDQPPVTIKWKPPHK
jgi:hypothetical protein